MAECRTCRFGVEAYDRRGYRIIRCEAREYNEAPWWYVEGKDPAKRTPIFSYLAQPECAAWQERRRG